jgi:GNAT superfamily N-acetyltransferase
MHEVEADSMRSTTITISSDSPGSSEPPKDAMETRHLTWTDRKPAAGCLARAFEFDPLMACLIPDTRVRGRLLFQFCDLVVQYGIRYGEVHASGDGTCGVAVWLPPGQTHVSLARLLYSGGWLLPFKVGIGCTRRILAFHGFADRCWRQLAPRSKWSLQMLGVAPPYQGHGHASRLMASMLQRLDKTAVVCTLETANPRNVSLYQRFGFQVLEETRVPGSSLNLWFMLRNA